MEKIGQSFKLSFEQRKQQANLIVLGLLLAIGAGIAVQFYFNYYQNRFYPRVYIDQIAVGGLELAEAKIKLESVWAEQTKNLALHINYDSNANYNFNTPDDTQVQLVLNNNFNQQLVEAMAVGKTDRFWQQLSLLWQKKEFYTQAQLDEDRLLEALATLAAQFDQKGYVASATLNYSGNSNSLLIDPGVDGRKLQIADTQEKIDYFLEKSWLKLTAEDLHINVIIASTSAQLDSEQLNMARERAEKLVKQNLVFTGEYKRAEFNDQELIALLRFPDGINTINIDEKTLDKLIEEKTKDIDRPAQNASFQFHRAENKEIIIDEFIPDLKGLKVDNQLLKNKIRHFIEQIDQNQDLTTINDNDITFFDLTMISKDADITLAQTNDFGINEVIGFGESWYFHSIPSRIYNVGIASKSMDLTLLAPGEEFFFNRILGNVSTATGYRTAYIIQDGATKLAPGGGVCQISSTLFRALLDAGVKITKRLPHSYRVSYYEINNEPGFDATVYSGNIDLRFINDTPGYILLEFKTYPENLYMTVKMYGSNDGRSTEIVNYKKWGYSSPLPTVYIPDPTLPSGKLKQIDWSSSGIKAEFTNVIKDKNGEVIREDYYYSSYQPWSAKYLQGI